MATAEGLHSRADGGTVIGDGGPDNDSGGPAPTSRQVLLRLLRPYRTSLVAVFVLQIVSSLAGLAPLIAVVELVLHGFPPAADPSLTRFARFTRDRAPPALA